ncbi:MAG: cell wall-binding repeat-containing protein [Erysipelotrichaceae bacterium]|nr:cell wall-binding repeat-containing protein [Erysipelotrichaceae bacterium]
MKKIMTLLSVCLMLISGSLCSLSAKAEGNTVDIPVEVTYHQEEARKTLSLLNDFRTGDEAWYWNSDNTTKTTPMLGTLTYDYGLEVGAMQRAVEVAFRFDHTRPNDAYCKSAYTDLGYDLGSWGENIAGNFYSAEWDIDVWKETDKPYSGQAHRRNMLGSAFRYYACSCVEYEGAYYWVQIFSSNPQSLTETVIPEEPVIAHVPVGQSHIADWYAECDKDTVLVGDVIDLQQSIHFYLQYDFMQNYYNPYYAVSYVPDWVCPDDTAEVRDDKLFALKEGQARVKASPSFLSTGVTFLFTIINGDRNTYRLAGASRYETSLKIADELKSVLGVERFENVILATGENFADALGGGYLAVKKKAPILLTKPSQAEKVNEYIRNNLKEGGTVYILGGDGAVPLDCLQGLDGFRKLRLSGKNRYETNRTILSEAGVFYEDILICSGTSFADALAASSTGRPIMLVGKTLNEDQMRYLQAKSYSNFYIIGGTGAVSAEAEAQINSVHTAQRLAGKTRYETSVLIAQAFFPTASKALLAYSHDFPDGLCAGPLGAAVEAPILLARTGNEGTANQYATSHYIRRGYVCGGESRLPDSTVHYIFAMPEDEVIIKK